MTSNKLTINLKIDTKKGKLHKTKLLYSLGDGLGKGGLVQLLLVLKTFKNLLWKWEMSVVAIFTWT